MGCIQSKEARVASKTGVSRTIRVDRCKIVLDSVTFVSSHHVLCGNDVLPDAPPETPDPFRIDWGYSGQPYPQPEWQRNGQNAPVSHTRREQICLLLRLRVEARQGDPPQGRVVGAPADADDRAFEFRSGRLTLRSKNEIVVGGEGALPGWPQRIDRRIRWTFQTSSSDRIEFAVSGPHTVFVTFGEPVVDTDTRIGEGGYEDGATLARMREATKRVQDIGECPSVTLIDRLFKTFDNYVLRAENLDEERWKEIENNKYLSNYIKDVGWPSFLKVGRWKEFTREEDLFKANMKKLWDKFVEEKDAEEVEEAGNRIATMSREREAEGSAIQRERDQTLRKQGGAWPLAILERYGGECQAIVRLIRGILTQLGHEGELCIRYVSVDASQPERITIGRNGNRCVGPRSDRGYSLVDTPVRVRERYTMGQVKWNKYEAFLRYRYKVNGQVYQAWYGGGVGLVGTPQPERSPKGPLTPAFERELLRMSFEGLAEYRTISAQPEVREVTNYWSYQ